MTITPKNDALRHVQRLEKQVHGLSNRLRAAYRRCRGSEGASKPIDEAHARKRPNLARR
jgi:hypothetical protein